MSTPSLPATCKAVVIHDVCHASFDEVEIPPIGPHDVAVKIAYVGVCATDLEILDGTLGYYRNKIARYPIVPGHETSGIVVAVGSEVNNPREGDAVVVECIQGCGQCENCVADRPISCSHRQEMGVIGLNGGYAEFVVVPARFLHKISQAVDLQKASLCEPLAVAIKGLNRLEKISGSAGFKNCAVVGAGPLGRLCAMVLSHRANSVTLFDREPRRLAFQTGITTSETLDDLSMFDAIVEATGDQEALDVVLDTGGTGAHILLLGLPYAESNFRFENIVAYDKTIVGSVGSSAADFNDALALLPHLDTSAFDAPILPLEQFAHGWQLARARAHLKVTLSPVSA
jgi:2-desacetyl-2-hydroxyethyl bacteriochlorophyllide A dehydrogenase